MSKVYKKNKPNPEMQQVFRLASFTQINPRPVTEIDLKGGVLYMNKSASTAFPDLKKRGIRHPYLAELPNIIKVLKSGQKYFSREVKIKNRWFRHFFYLVPKVNSIVIYGLDISEQKQDEERIKGEEKRYHMLFETMNYGYALQDIVYNKQKKPADYRFVDVNPAFEKLSGMKKEAIVGKTANEISQAPKTKESIALRKKYDQVAIDGKPLYLESYNPLLKKYFELYAYKPNAHQLALIFSDITARKKTDEEKNNFIAIMSHELRNPLTPILANAQFIKSILPEHNLANSTIRDAIAIIEKEAKTMATLLNDILDVSRLSRQKIQLNKSKINICEVVKNSVKTSMPFINTKEQDIKVFFKQDPLYINADPVRLEQVVVNIINNASKYTDMNGAIWVRCGIKGEHVEIRVKDNGMGMDKNKIKRIFDLFSDDSQPFMGIGGLGIGLNIVKNLVSMHGGLVTVKSAGAGKGSEFTIRLPMEKTLLKLVEKPEELKPANKKASRVLIVEDNKDIRQAFSQLLVSHGHEVKTSHDGLGAMKISQTFKPHTALIDIGLPGMSGHELARKIRLAGNKKIRLIAVTGFGQEKDIAKAKESGFDHHLTKPVDIDQLLTLL